MKAAEIRSSFLHFFEQRGHSVVPSDSLIPSTDPTLLFTSAGMVQFKPNFQNPDASPYPRATSSQKCLRTSDIERVGHTLRHLTFFEMLGNFSFGDYFKKESIAWGWEFLTKTMGLPGDRMIASVYRDDDEAFAIWKSIVPENRIVRLGEDSNFWTMGPTGPCGPCSEILFDRGDAWGPAGDYDSDRYLEIWNHVFTQFDKQADGSLKPLPRKNIDTGMGLERLTLVVQGVDSAFDTDGFQILFGALSELAKRKSPLKIAPGGVPAPDLIAFRRISDHVRALTFMIGDGILPSNEGRGYVLRRLLRQAERAGKTLGLHEPFLHKLTASVIDTMKGGYPDLASRRETIATVVKLEEEKFLETLDAGTRRLEELMTSVKSKQQTVLAGTDVFQLYDTFGFPLELTKEIAVDQGFNVDEDGFKAAKQKAADLARTGWKGSGAQDVERYRTWKTKVKESSRFRGYDTLELDTVVAGPLFKKTAKGWVETERLEAGDEGQAFLPETPFYAEGGGQVGDVGTWTSPLAHIDVIDTQAPIDGLTVHFIRVKEGVLQVGQTIHVAVDRLKRESTMRHHTATHLLHKALRQLLGEHITQAGSLVAPDRLRFDFTHFSPLTPDQRRQIEDLVNAKILADIPVQPHEVSMDEARSAGAMALFGEKYGSRVRTIRVHDGDWSTAAGHAWSLELCGGTHVRATGQIGLFKIISEAAVGAGVRRLEAVTGFSSLEAIRSLENKLQQEQERSAQQRKEFDRQLESIKSAAMRSQFTASDNPVQDVGGIRLVSRQLPGVDNHQLREAGDILRDKQKVDVVILASVTDGKISFIVTVQKDTVAKGIQAGVLAKAIAAKIDGSGGGKPEFAQGGGKNVGALDSALAGAGDLLQSLIKK